MNLIRLLQGDRQPEVDLKRTYDAVVIGSGAAGGMAAHVLTSRGHEGADARGREEARHRRGAEVDGVAVRTSAARRHAARPPSAVAQRVHHPSAAVRRRLEVHQGLLVRAGLGRHRLLQEHRRRREGPSVHRHELRVGARAVPRRQDEHLGPARAPVVRLRLQGEEPRRLRRGLADRVQGPRAVLRPGRSVPRDLRRQGEPAAPARQPVPASDEARPPPR